MYVFTPVSIWFFLPFIPPLALISPTIFDSTDITSFHSPVHEGSVDVDEIDEDLKDEAVLDEDVDDDGFRAVAAK